MRRGLCWSRAGRPIAHRLRRLPTHSAARRASRRLRRTPRFCQSDNGSEQGGCTGCPIPDGSHRRTHANDALPRRCRTCVDESVALYRCKCPAVTSGIPGLIVAALRRCADVNPASSACKTFVRAVRQPAFQVARRLPRCTRALSRRPSTNVLWLNPTEREATDSPVVQGFVIPALSSRDWWLRHACGCAQSIGFRAPSRGTATRHRGEWGRIGRGTPACVAGGEFLSNPS